jgi:guanylate kinase
VGKGSIAAALEARFADLWLSRSWTTRPRRTGEAPDAYVFVDRAAFEAKAADGGFLESAAVFDQLYGTPVPEPPPGSDVLLEIDVQGAAQVKSRYPEAVVILVRAPSPEAQEARLRGRGDDEEVIARRLATAVAEEEAALAFADHVVVNDDLHRAVEESAAILESHRSPR